jgi:hypothetical protein
LRYCSVIPPLAAPFVFLQRHPSLAASFALLPRHSRYCRVIPAQAGTQWMTEIFDSWIPLAGMTDH